MKERMGIPKANTERGLESDQDDTGFIPSAAEEKVLAMLHDKTSTPGAHADKETLGLFHNEIERCECYPVLSKYTSGEIPTLGTMFRGLPALLTEFGAEIERDRKAGASEEELRPLILMHGLISGREQQVRSSIHRYVNSVVRFQHLQKISAGGTRDVTKQFVEADHARRRAHDGLIDSLKVYAAQVAQLKTEGFDTLKSYSFTHWNMGDDARRTSESTLVFSPDVVRNREFIRDWALAADFSEQLTLLGDEAYLIEIGGRS